MIKICRVIGYGQNDASADYTTASCSMMPLSFNEEAELSEGSNHHYKN
jgi:hypothetical protein